MSAVVREEYPTDRVPKGPEFKNESGLIRNIAFGQFGGMAIIESVAGSLRSNHYHLTDWHYLTVLRGEIHYYWRPAGMRVKPWFEIYSEGDTFFTPPMIEHAVFSPVTTRMISLSKLSRRHDTHESDLVRVKLMEMKNGKVVQCPL